MVRSTTRPLRALVRAVIVEPVAGSNGDPRREGVRTDVDRLLVARDFDRC